MSFKFNPLIFSGLDLVGAGSGGAPYFMPPVPTELDLPAGATDGELRVVLDTDHVYVYNGDDSKWRDTGLTQAAAFGSTPNAEGYSLAVDNSGAIQRNVITLQPADGSNPGGVSITDQDFAGIKTFNDGVDLAYATSLRMLATNSSGIVESIDNWQLDPSVGQLNVYLTYEPPVDAGPIYSTLQRFETNIDPDQTTSDDNPTTFDVNTYYDRNNTGFDHNGYLRSLNVSSGHEGSGQLGQQAAVNINQYSNNGGTTDQMYGLEIFQSLQNSSVINDGFGIRNNFSGVNGGTLGSFQSYSASISGDFTSNVIMDNNYWDATSTDNVTGLNFQSSSTSTGSNINGANINILGQYDSVFLLNTYANVNINGFGAGLNLQTDNATTADGFTGINVVINGTYTNGVVGVNSNTNTAVVGAGQRAYTYSGNGGGTNINSQFTPPSSAIIDQGNVLVTFMTVNNGSPLTGTDVINQNLSSLIFAQDDVAMGPIGLGVVGVGFVGQVAVDSGKTVDSISMALGGAGIPVQSTGGTVDNMHLFQAKGVLAQGGTVVVNNLYGFKVDANFGGGMATNAWGVYVEDDTIDNFFAGPVELGTSLLLQDPGAGTDKVTIQAPTGLGADYTLTLPDDAGLSGQLLQTDGTGLLSWVDVISPGDIAEKTFNGLENQTNANITDFLFAGTVKSFTATVNVTVDATTPLFEHFTIVGVNKNGTWSIFVQSFGDDTDVDFSITSGQMEYTSSSYAGFNDLIINFRAITLNN